MEKSFEFEDTKSFKCVVKLFLMLVLILSGSWLKRGYGFSECRSSLYVRILFPPSENINAEANDRVRQITT